MDTIAKKNLKAKAPGLLSELPRGFEELTQVDLDSLEREVGHLQVADGERLERIRDLVTQLEALKMLSSQFSAAKAGWAVHVRDALFYRDLLPLLLKEEGVAQMYDQVCFRSVELR